LGEKRKTRHLGKGRKEKGEGLSSLEKADRLDFGRSVKNGGFVIGRKSKLTINPKKKTQKKR